jgi:hypothetical protein
VDVDRSRPLLEWTVFVVVVVWLFIVCVVV